MTFGHMNTRQEKIAGVKIGVFETLQATPQCDFTAKLEQKRKGLPPIWRKPIGGAHLHVNQLQSRRLRGLSRGWLETERLTQVRFKSLRSEMIHIPTKQKLILSQSPKQFTLICTGACRLIVAIG
jgi:hypothetical protein